MSESFFPYDLAEALGTREAIQIFMADAFETGDPAHIAAALNVVARAKGMSELGYQARLSPEQLCALSPNGNPTLKTILGAMKALGMDIAVTMRHMDGAGTK